MNPESSARAERALFALRCYLLAKSEGFAHEDLDIKITDLLADLRYLCDELEELLEELDGSAAMNIDAESGEGGPS